MASRTPRHLVPVKGHQIGRPSKLTADVQQTIIETIIAGNYFHVACQYAGINPSSGWAWLQRGRDAITRSEETDTPIPASEMRYTEFLEAVTQARAQAEVRLVTLVSQAAKDDWRAGVEILKRGFRENWRDEATVQHQGSVTVDVTDESLARLESIAAIMLESSDDERTG